MLRRTLLVLVAAALATLPYAAVSAEAPATAPNPSDTRPLQNTPAAAGLPGACEPAAFSTGSAPLGGEQPLLKARSFENTGICSVDTDFAAYCTVGVACDPANACTGNADCPSGSRCMKDNCCGYDICSPVTGFCGGGGYCGFYQPCTNIQEVVDQNQSVADEYVAGFDQPDLAQSFHQDRFNIK